MRTSALVLGLVLAACNGDRAQPAPAAGSSASQVPRTAPHSGAIENIAVTDDGTAAFTIDGFGQARLWPTLDGTREPVIVRGDRARAVALARTDDGFVAARIDVAGGLELVRLDRDGRTLGHTLLPPEPGFTLVRALAGGVLVLGRDQRLVWLDERGRARGNVAPPQGTRIVDVAVRRDRAVVALAEGAASTVRARWIATTPALAWGDELRMAVAIEAPIALSPGGTRLAARHGSTGRMVVVDLITGTVLGNDDGPPLGRDAGQPGFLADNSAVYVTDAGLSWWTRAGAPARHRQRGGSDVAIGDGVVLDAASTMLTVLRTDRAAALGYRVLATHQTMWPTAAGLAVDRDRELAWLDRSLADALSASDDGDAIITPLDDRHMAVFDDDHLHVRDVTTDEVRDLGEVEGAAGMWEPATQVLSLIARARVERLRIDLRGAERVTPLPPIELAHGELFEHLVPLDPARAHGALAVALVQDAADWRLDWYADPGGGAPLVVLHSEPLRERRPLHADGTGVVYLLDQRMQSIEIYDPRGTRRTIAAPAGALAVAPSLHGDAIAVATPTHVIVLDGGTAQERWRATLASASELRWARDGKTLFAAAAGGLRSFEVASGRAIATACAWDFGLHPLTAVRSDVFAAANLCSAEEP